MHQCLTIEFEKSIEIGHALGWLRWQHMADVVAVIFIVRKPFYDCPFRRPAIIISYAVFSGSLLIPFHSRAEIIVRPIQTGSMHLSFHRRMCSSSGRSKSIIIIEAKHMQCTILYTIYTQAAELPNRKTGQTHRHK